MDRVTIALLIGATMLLAGCGGSDEPAQPSESEQLRAISTGLDQQTERLRDAVADARTSDRSSMVTLRATADRTGDVLRATQQELQMIPVSSQADLRSQTRQLDGALQELRALTDALSRRSISITDLELAAERVDQATRDADLALPSIETDRLIASLRRSRRTRTPAKTRDGVSAPVGSDNTVREPSTTAFLNYTGPAFQAKLPSGGGWASPAQSQPTPGQLFRTSVRGPGGLFVIIDYTPFEPANFGGSFSSRTQVGQTAFGSATKYVFRGGRLPECQRSTCIDYIINDRSRGSGFGVLAGGGSFSSAERIARTVAESVVPTGE